MIPDADLASLMKQMPGMVLSTVSCLALKTVVLLWTIVTGLAGYASFNSARSYPHWLSVSNHSISDAEDRLQGYYDALAKVVLRPMTGW